MQDHNTATKQKIIKKRQYSVQCSNYNKKIEEKLLAFEIYCYRKILQVSWTYRKTNKEICETDLLQRAIHTVQPHLQSGQQQKTKIISVRQNRRDQRKRQTMQRMDRPR